MADLVSMRADAAAIRQDIEGILSSDSELTVEQVATLDSKREKLEALQDQVNRAESVEAAREAISRPTFRFQGGNGKAGSREINAAGIDSRTRLHEAMKAAYRGERLDQRFIDFGSGETGATNNAASTLAVDLQDEMIRLLGSRSAIRQACQVRSYATDVEIPVVSARATITATTAEGAAYDTFEPDFSKLRFRSYKSGAETEITEEVVADARGGIVDEILMQHAEAHAYFWETLYCGTAATQNTGAPDGLLATEANIANSGVFPDEANGGTTAIFDQTASGAAIADVTYSDLLGVAFGMPAKYWGLPKTWVMSPALYQHVLGLTDDSGTTGRPLFLGRASGTIQDDFTLGSLFGYPVLVSDALTDATPAASYQALLLERGSYVVADRQGISTQFDEFSKGAEGKVIWRSRLRSDGRWVRPSSSARLLMAAV